MKIKDPMCPAKTQRNQTNTKSKKRMTVDTITSLINSNNLQPSLVFLLYYLTFRKLKASLSNLQLMSHLFKIMYWFLAVLGLCCWEGFSLVAGSRGLLSSCRLPIAVAPLASEHCLWGMQAPSVAACGLQRRGSVVVVQGFSCSKACGIFSSRGSNPSPLHWQADS